MFTSQDQQVIQICFVSSGKILRPHRNSPLGKGVKRCLNLTGVNLLLLPMKFNIVTDTHSLILGLHQAPPASCSPSIEMVISMRSYQVQEILSGLAYLGHQKIAEDRSKKAKACEEDKSTIFDFLNHRRYHYSLETFFSTTKRPSDFGRGYCLTMIKFDSQLTATAKPTPFALWTFWKL
jgi:hypothetical protein